ncbi:MAG: metal-sensitive transcriptional regulator [Planctomycetales bacterium]|nr:metal-sensitive transcriptional regulator [Planctomycetales bacterium]
MLSIEEKKKLNNRLRRVIGQVEAVGRMIDQEASCVDVLMQLSAATGALSRVGQLVLDEHLQTSLAEAAASDTPAQRDEKLAELIELFRKYGGVLE